MKSDLVMNAPYIKRDDRRRYTDLQVLRSNAGWYVGTLYNNPEGFQEPGSRDSGYFATKEEAEAELKLMEQQ